MPVKQEELEPVYCSRCGKCLTYNDGATITGLTLKIKGLQSDTIGRRIKKQLGELAPNDVDNCEFNFCHKCFLSAYFK